MKVFFFDFKNTTIFFCLLKMAHRLFVRNNVQEPRSLAELEIAFENAVADRVLSEEQFGSVTKQIRQELLVHSSDGGALRDQVCRVDMIRLAKTGDLLEMFALLSGVASEDYKSAVELLLIALMDDGDSLRELELCALFRRNPQLDKWLARVSPSALSLLIGDGWIAAQHNVVGDECLDVLLVKVRAKACAKLNLRFAKVFRGERRHFKE